MDFQSNEKTPFITDSIKQYAVIGILLAMACLFGLFVPTVSSSSSSQMIGLSFVAVLGIVGILAVILELPVITVVRFAFIASFFFKGELNFYKIDEIEDPSGFNISLTFLTGLILLGYDLFIGNKTCRVKIFPATFSILTAELFFCAIVSVIYSGSTLLGWFSVWSFSTSVLIALAIASHFSQRERLIQLVSGLAIGLLFTGVVALSQYLADFPTDLAFFGTGTEEEQLGTQSQILARVPAFLRTPTEMAWVISTLLPLIIAPIICRVKGFGSWQKIILLTGAFSGIIAVILSLARGSWISLVVAPAIVILFGWFRLSASERKTYFISAVGVTLLTCLLLAPFADKIYGRLTEDDQGSALVRVPLMETALRMIEDNRTVGVGLNSYRANMTKYDETGIFVSQVFPNPVHNVFAHITAEIGIPGGIIFCLLIFVSLFECVKTMTMQDRLLFALALGAMAGIIAFVISGLKEPGSLGSVRPPLRTCFFLFGIVLAMSRIRRQLIF